jgi:membrane protease YdiL (CAAX protease family)
MTDTERAPGWYDDPYQRLTFRWWDGTAWTGYAADTAVRWDEVPDDGDREPEPPAPRGLGVALAGYVIGVALAAAIAIGLRAADRPGGRAVQLLASQLGLWAGLVGACIYVSRRRGTGSLRADFGWQMRPIDVGLGFAGSFVARIVAAIVVTPAAAAFRNVRAPDRDVFDKVTTSTGAWIVIVLIVCVGAPLVEELFFRGLLQSRLVEVTSSTVGIVVTAILFGAAHLLAWEGTITLLYGLGIVGAGLVLGLMRHASTRLGPSTWAHAFFNAQAMLAVALLS